MLELYKKVKNIVLREGVINRGDTIIVGVSGGADSLSLLYLLHDIKKENQVPFSLYVAHLNHGLRGKTAKEDARFVSEEAKKLDLPCKVGKVNAEEYRRKKSLSPEDAARRLRYQFLRQIASRIGADSIAVGHNLNDQVETILLNFLRGTGLDGLTGMKFIRRIGQEGLFLIRPLLEIDREEIESYSSERGLSPRLDETNLQKNYRRNKARRELLPYIEEQFNPNFSRAVYRMTRLLSQDRDFLEEEALSCFKRIVLKEEDELLTLNIKKLLEEHLALQRRVLRAAVRKFLGFVPWDIGAEHIDFVLELCHKEAPHSKANLPYGLEVSRSYDELLISLSKRQDFKQLLCATLKVPSEITLGQSGMKLKAEIVSPGDVKWPPDSSKEAYLDYDKVVEIASMEKTPAFEQNELCEELELIIRIRRPGDRFYPLGAPGKKKLKDYFIDRKVALEERNMIPLIAAGSEIIWVAGIEISQNCKITSQTKRVLHLKLE